MESDTLVEIKPNPFSIGTLISINFIKHSLRLLIGLFYFEFFFYHN